MKDEHIKKILNQNPVNSAITTIKKLKKDREVTEIKEDNLSSGDEKKKRKKYIDITLMFFSAMLIASGIIFEQKLHNSFLNIGEYSVFLTAYFISGWKVLYRAGKNIINKSFFDENFLMSVSTLGAIAIHELPEAAGVMLFFQVGEYLQDLSLERSRRSISSLLKIKPGVAHVKSSKKIHDSTPESVKVGQIIIIKPGEKVPLDGVVLKGTSYLDTSPITGEPVPKSVSRGDTVFAGTINTNGLLTVKVSKPFRDSSISKIIHLVEKASEKKAKTEQFITRFSRIYSPGVVLLAVCTAVLPPFLIQGSSFSEWIYRALVLLVISCPCALVISIPLGYFGGIGAASRRGILVKGSQFLDSLKMLKKVVFDKTGTLTMGVFQVSDIVPTSNFSKEDILKLAATAESNSQHPIARSIIEAYGKPIPSDDISYYKEIKGCGILVVTGGKKILVGNDHLLHIENIVHPKCKIEGTVVHVALDWEYCGYIIISDKLREDAKISIDRLRELGVDSIGMLTGDNIFSAKSIARKLGLDFFYADLLPQDKVITLEKYILEEGAITAFVGDGINDAPVIARADVGIAMGGMGSDAAIETADVVLMTDSLSKVAEAVNVAKKTRKIVWQNIYMALIVKGLFLILGTAGVATMWEAVFADMGVSILAIFNSLRVLK